MNNLSVEAKIIHLAMKQASGQNYGAEINRLLLNGDIDWLRLKDLLGYHEIAALFYAVLKDGIHFLPQEFAGLLSKTFYWTLRDNLQKLKQFQLVKQAFENEGIGLAALKGLGLIAQFYEHLPVRPMADMDILLKEEDYEKGAGVLKRIGYKKELLGLKESYWRNEQCHVTFVKQEEGKTGNILEAHWSLDFKRNGRPILSESWQRLKDMDAGFGRMTVLSAEDTLFSLALHQRRFGKEFCLKYILDIAFLFKKHSADFDWDYFLSACRRYGLYSCVGFLLLQGKLCLNSGLFDYGLKMLPLSKSKRAIMERFIAHNLASLQLGDKIKENYLKSHFLLYDTYSEPVKYILNIPLEQFAKFHGLMPYKGRTKRLYALRFIYILFCSWQALLRNNRLKKRVNLDLSNASKQGLSAIRAWGWSMHPNIQDGDLVIIKQRQPRRGEVVCFASDAQTKTLHRLVKFSKGYFTTKGDNCLSLDKDIGEEEVLGVAIALRRGKRIIPIKGRWLHGYFYFLSGLIICGRDFLKMVIMRLQELRVYSWIIRVIFSKRNIEISKEAETEDFYLIRAMVNGREAAALKIDKKSCLVIYVYVKIIYRKLGLEERLKREADTYGKKS
ncbi:hypothetical protein EPN16_05420 [bacterium]|nr:MAG: hypothetical protein EPN16_05420 [bacterium]